MQSAQWFASVSLGSFNPAWQPVGAGDIYHSGTDYLIWLNATTGQVNTWLLHSS